MILYFAEKCKYLYIRNREINFYSRIGQNAPFRHLNVGNGLGAVAQYNLKRTTVVGEFVPTRSNQTKSLKKWQLGRNGTQAVPYGF